MEELYPYKLGSGVLPERLYDKFLPEVHEYLVACGGGSTSGAGIAGREDDPPIAMTNILGYIELDTGRRHGKRSNMRWDISAEEYRSADSPYKRHFKEGIIYRVKACPVRLPELMSNEFGKGWLYVTEVLGACLSEPYLLGLIEEYNKPVTLRSQVFGEMPLNKRGGYFESERDWLGVKTSFVIFADNSETDINDQLKKLEALYADREKWDRAFREFAAKELTATANQWLDDRNFDADIKDPPITEEDFARRIRISSVELSGRDYFEVYFSDDAMFAVHTVCIYGSLSEGLKSADLMG